LDLTASFAVYYLADSLTQLYTAGQ